MSGWWGFDLDGTLAQYDGWGDGSIGAPITPMIRRIKHYLKQGRPVKIVTARVYYDDAGHAPGGKEEYVTECIRIQQWCKEHLGRVIPITFKKTCT